MGRKGWKEELKAKEIGQLSTATIIKALQASEEVYSFENKVDLAKHNWKALLPRQIHADIDSSEDTVNLLKELFQSKKV